MFPQSDWEVMLDGDSQGLRSMANYQKSNDYLRVWGGVDHWLDCPNDHFSFNSLYFEGEDDPKVVWQISYEILSLFNGASELFTRKARKLTIFGINLQEKSTDHQPNEFLTGLLGLPGISEESTEEQVALAAAKRDEELKKAVPASPRMALLILATENEDVYMMLKYLDLGMELPDYYKLMETILWFAKEKSLSLTYDSAKKTQFTNTANNFSLAGFNSRHGFKKNVKANKTPSMTIDEAHVFVTDLCKNYLIAAYPKTFQKKK